jgi:16S rRNA (cytosine967-C5)-methyltransferase
VRLLAAVIDTRTPLDGLTDSEHGHPQFRALDVRDRGLVRAILTTSLRFRNTIEALIAARLDRPLPVNATALSHILHVGAAQILFLDVPDSAAVDVAVSLAQADPRTRRFAGLVNAVLREIARRKERALPAALRQTVDAPAWFAERLHAAYGDARAAAILDNHRREAAIDLTVKQDADAWAERLGGRVLPTGSVRLGAIAGGLTDLPGYAEGAWWVQDAAASLPARLLGDIGGRRVADLCAAPGGKAAQLAAGGARVTAVDISANRLLRLRENLERLGLKAESVCADILSWQPDRPFDAVLLDSPCSATGTARRHPDVLWTKTPDDVEKLAGLQRRLLERTATLVAPGGTVVFANCSLDPREGEHVVEAVTAAAALTVDRIAPSELPGLEHLVTPEGFLRTTPAELPGGEGFAPGMDGFFAARLRRPT